MFGWFKKKQKQPSVVATVAHQPPGEVFPWPKGWQLTALDEVVIAVPAAILSDHEVIGSVIHCDNGVELNLPTGPHRTADARIMLWLRVGQSAWLSKSCQGVIVPQADGDIALRRLRLTEVVQQASQGTVPGTSP
jgi:hypothetical protein